MSVQTVATKNQFHMPSKTVIDLIKQVAEIKADLSKHLEGSGYIQTDLVWLKKAFWILTSASVIATLSLISGLLLYLLKK